MNYTVANNSWNFPAPAPETVIPVPVPTGSPPAYVVSLGSGEALIINCANSSSPIRYNTAVSGQNIITSLWFNTALGLILYALFVIFRGRFKLYQARLEMPQVSRKPPHMKMSGISRIYSWLDPVFKVSDEDFLKSAGLDALVAVRIIGFGVLLLLPLTILGAAVLIPVNYTDDWYKSGEYANSTDEFSSVFMRLTISNITPGSSLFWVHFVFVYIFVAWGCWLTKEHYKEYIALRQAYMVKATELPPDASGISTPLLSTPMKKARPGSPIKATQSRPVNKLKMPRRDASRTDFDQFSLDANNGALNGFPTVSLRSRFAPVKEQHHQRNVSDGSASQQLFHHDSRLPPLPSHSRHVSDGGGGGVGAPSRPSSSRAPSDGGSSRTVDGLLGPSISNPFARGVILSDAAVSEEPPPPRSHLTKWTEVDFSAMVGKPLPQDIPPAVIVERAEQPAASLEWLARNVTLSHGLGETAADEMPVDDPLGTPIRQNDEEEEEEEATREAPPSVLRHEAVAVALALDSGGVGSSAAAVAAIKRHRRQQSMAGSHSNSGWNTPRAITDDAARSAGTTTATTTMTGQEEDTGGVVAGTKRPPKPAELTQAVMEAFASDTTNSEIPSAVAELISPRNATGIDHRWWRSVAVDAEQSCEKSFPVPRSQSITFKTGVPVYRRDGSAVCANAALYTVLVVDVPVDRLKLRRLGHLEFWHNLDLSPTSTVSTNPNNPNRISSRLHTQRTWTSLQPSATHTSEMWEMALADMERGEETTAAAVLGAPDVPTGTWRQWPVIRAVFSLWEVKSEKYKEWRRDVHWAIFNKRVRTATDMFTRLFGDDFDAIIPIYPTRAVDTLIHKWDSNLAKMERLQVTLREASGKEKKVKRLKQKIVKLQKNAHDLQKEITVARDATLSDLPSTCFFATFKSQRAAAIAAQANLNPIMQTMFKVTAAPRPDDVNWPTVQRGWWARTMRPIYVLPFIIAIMLLPIGAFTGAFAQLTIALCGAPTGEGKSEGALYGSWFCSDNSYATFLRNLLTSFVPSTLLSIYHMVVLPVMVYYAAQAEGNHISLSALDRRCADLFFYWDVFNVFLGAMLGGSVVSELNTYLDDPSQIWRSLGSAIPASSNFFINYVAYRALVMAAFRLFYPSQAIMTALARWMRLLPKPKTARDRALILPVRNCRYGRDVGIPVMMNYVMVLAYAVVSPLILPFGLLYFILLWAVWRYQMLYVYQRQYESGGQFWPFVAHKVVGCNLIMVLFTGAVLLVKAAYTQAILLLVTLPLFLLRFDSYLSTRYDAVVAQVPLTALDEAKRAENGISSKIWTPPPLRDGAEGWHPEWGKVWQWWGVPRYTV